MIKYATRAALIAVGFILLLLTTAALKFLSNGGSAPTPVAAGRSYLKAVHARDYREAYRFISSADQSVLDEQGYLQAQVAPRGFASQLANHLAAHMDIRVVEDETQGDRARLTFDYKVPTADEFSAVLYDWDQDKLNALPRVEQQRILALLEKMKKRRDLITTGGRETFTLVKEGGHWKIFLDWASAIKVSFAAAAPHNNALQVEVLRQTLFASMDEPFQTSLKLKNPGKRTLVTRIDHRIEPAELSGRIAMIACGFLRPVTLNPGEEREVSSAYLLDAGFPKNTPLRITFEFHLASPPSAEYPGHETANAPFAIRAQAAIQNSIKSLDSGSR